MLTYQQITGMNLADIEKEIQKAERELLEVRMKIQLGQEKDNSKQKKFRKLIAQLKTAFAEKRAQESVTTTSS